MAKQIHLAEDFIKAFVYNFKEDALVVPRGESLQRPTT